MKNIHVIPTDKPNEIILNLIKNQCSNDVLAINNINVNWYLLKYQNIYITNDEEIKQGDWCINLNSLYNHKELCRIDNQLELERYAKKTSNKCKKIILTTDADLIKDGVQAIDDDFLEWFVNNPSCEEVTVIYEPKNYLDIKQGWEYEIIILKEEPKKEYQTCKCVSNWFNTTADKPFCFKCGESVKEDFKPTEETCTCTDECLGYLTKTCKGIETLEQIDQNNPVTRGSTALLYKQETLEGSADKWVFETNGHKWSNNDDTAGDNYGSFIAGYKLAKERSYSEEEVFKLLMEFSSRDINSSSGTPHSIAKWFEQFKKK